MRYDEGGLHELVLGRRLEQLELQDASAIAVEHFDGKGLQRAFQRWLNTASVEKLLSASIGNDPSLRDVLRLAQPTPVDRSAVG